MKEKIINKGRKKRSNKRGEEMNIKNFSNDCRPLLFFVYSTGKAKEIYNS